MIADVNKVVKRFGTIWSSKLGDSIDKSLMKLDSPSETRLWVSGEDESGVPLNSTHLPMIMWIHWSWLIGIIRTSASIYIRRDTDKGVKNQGWHTYRWKWCVLFKQWRLVFLLEKSVDVDINKKAKMRKQKAPTMQACLAPLPKDSPLPRGFQFDFSFNMGYAAATSNGHLYLPFIRRSKLPSMNWSSFVQWVLLSILHIYQLEIKVRGAIAHIDHIYIIMRK